MAQKSNAWSKIKSTRPEWWNTLTALTHPPMKRKEGLVLKLIASLYATSVERAVTRSGVPVVISTVLVVALW